MHTKASQLNTLTFSVHNRVHYWVEVQTQTRKIANVDTQRGKMLGSISAYTALNVTRVVGECLRLDTFVLVAKMVGKCAAAAAHLTRCASQLD